MTRPQRALRTRPPAMHPQALLSHAVHPPALPQSQVLLSQAVHPQPMSVDAALVKGSDPSVDGSWTCPAGAGTCLSRDRLGDATAQALLAAVG